jgi:hypothetical protein
MSAEAAGCDEQAAGGSMTRMDETEARRAAYGALLAMADEVPGMAETVIQVLWAKKDAEIEMAAASLKANGEELSVNVQILVSTLREMVRIANELAGGYAAFAMRLTELLAEQRGVTKRQVLESM